MIPELFSIGPITINSFGLMAMLGFLMGTILLRKEVVRYGHHPDLANSIIIAAMIGGFLGARIYFILERWNQFLADPSEFLFTGAGLVWYGGLIGGFLAVFAYVHRKKIAIIFIADLMAPLLALGQTFGRMGCLLSGDGDYGPPTDLPWAMSFPKGIVPTAELVHPTPIYDMLILLSIFALLWKIRTKPYPRGFKFGLYLVLLGFGRIFTEFFRTTAVVFAGLTAAQLISVVLIISGTAFILKARAGKAEDYRAPSKSGELKAKSS
ncbi:prolipoprotein diacylglyceryl transferase [bacterium]|nr:prolipoprotein diacylglyceryl transferase [bacterium]